MSDCLPASQARGKSSLPAKNMRRRAKISGTPSARTNNWWQSNNIANHLRRQTMLFGTHLREDSSPKLNRESEYAFLNRSARMEIGKVRELLEQLLSQYPENERSEMVARIQSGNNTNFRSASFELLLYAVLSRLGFKLHPHPELANGSSSRPDFLVEADNGSVFLLEAVLASAGDDSDPAAKTRIDTTLDALSKGGHANFMVAIEWEGAPVTQPSGARLRGSIVKWLDTLDPDEIQAQIDKVGIFEVPALSWAHENWQVVIRPIPVRKDRRSDPKTLIGVISGGVGFIDEWSPIRNAIKFKGAKYGKLDLPLIVAVNVDGFNLDRIDEMQALFGQEQFTFSTEEPGREPRFSRAPNGAWRGKSGPQATRVSGAWIFNRLSPYNIASRRHTLYFNPWASSTLPHAVLAQIPHAIAENGKIRWEGGVALHEVLGLSEGWPE